MVKTKSEKFTSGAVSLAIDQNAELVDLAAAGEEITELVLGGGPWDVADEDWWATGSTAGAATTTASVATAVT